MSIDCSGQLICLIKDILKRLIPIKICAWKFDLDVINRPHEAEKEYRRGVSGFELILKILYWVQIHILPSGDAGDEYVIVIGKLSYRIRILGTRLLIDIYSWLCL